MKEKELKEIEGIIEAALSKKARDRLVEIGHNYGEESGATIIIQEFINPLAEPIPALIKAIREGKSDCNCEAMIDKHNKT